MEKPTIEFKDGKKIAKFKDGTVQEHTVEQHGRAGKLKLFQNATVSLYCSSKTTKNIEEHAILNLMKTPVG